MEVFTSLEVPEEITFREEGKRIIVSTPPATITSVQLSDGSKVLLSANSRLEYLKEFTDTIRSVKLSGEARFEVAKDASRPFIVCTEQLQTRVKWMFYMIFDCYNDSFVHLVADNLTNSGFSKISFHSL